MNQHQYLALYEKFLSGACTPEEEEMLYTYSKDFIHDDLWEPEMGKQEIVKQHILQQIQYKIEQPKAIYLPIYRWVAAASVIMLLSVASWLIFKPAHAVKNISAGIPSNLKGDILPGSNKATLTLANGKTIVLNAAGNGVITKQGGTQVAKLNSGQIVYSQLGTDNDKLLLNTMSTPRGGNFNLTLADGTKVFLNAESSITYPANFVGNNREVSITGEAYFEVAKNPLKPFIVNANGTQTRVLGTHFDIMAYKDEAFIKTTLFEGSVKFSKNNSEVLLKPGQQASMVSATNKITVQDANLEEALAWKNGYFLFQDEDIQSIMRKAARWYDVEVIYDGDIKNLSFGGSVSRYKNISDMLKILQSTGVVNFKIDGRRVTVMK